MTIATRNGAIIVKDGKAAENCGCCGGACPATPRNPAVGQWAGGGSIPTTVRLLFSYTGASRNTIITVFGAPGQPFVSYRKASVFASTSLNATYTLGLGQAYATAFGECTYFVYSQSDSLIATVLPGVTCGGGWDAVLAIWGSVLFASNGGFVSFSDVPAQTPTTYQSEPSVSGAAATSFVRNDLTSIRDGTAMDAIWPTMAIDKGPSPISIPTVGTNTPIPAAWSVTPCSTSPNPSLAGMIWEAWVKPSTTVRVGSDTRAMYMEPFLACTISVV